jgi:hypothetical protein
MHTVRIRRTVQDGAPGRTAFSVVCATTGKVHSAGTLPPGKARGAFVCPDCMAIVRLEHPPRRTATQP